MKHVYPPRHPAWLDAKPGGQSPASPESTHESNERDESGADRSGGPQRQVVGNKAPGDAEGGGAGTDRRRS